MVLRQGNLYERFSYDGVLQVESSELGRLNIYKSMLNVLVRDFTRVQ